MDILLKRRHCSPSCVSVAFDITYVSGTRIFITVQFLLRREGVKHVYVFLLVDSVNSCLPMVLNICNTWHEDVGDTVIQTVGKLKGPRNDVNMSLSKQAFQNLADTARTPSSKIPNSTFCPQCIYMIYMDLRTNIDFTL